MPFKIKKMDDKSKVDKNGIDLSHYIIQEDKNPSGNRKDRK